MRINTTLRRLGSLVGIALLTLVVGFNFITSANADSLYIGDGGDDSVKRFNAETGAYLGDFVAPGSNGLLGPRGLIFTQSRLLLVNQNVNQPFAGEILSYYRDTGAFQEALVPCNPPLRSCDPDAPFAPRGLVRGYSPTMFVTDLGPDFTTPGAVKQYNANTGEFIRDLDPTGFTGNYFPRGLVFGPDHLLYVTIIGGLDPNLSNFDRLAGYILRFNSVTGKFKDVFARYDPSARDCSKYLHRPDGLTFGPDGKLYVTSFQANPDDTDKILVFDKHGKCRDRIDLYQLGEPRAFAQALVFGPSKRLFVPITNTGEVRRYNMKSKTFDVFVKANANGGPLGAPFYLTFRKTDPRTLEYKD